MRMLGTYMHTYETGTYLINTTDKLQARQKQQTTDRLETW